MRLEKYSEYLIEYSVYDDIVTVSGLDEDGFWIELIHQNDIADPESYAYGMQDALTAFRPNVFYTVSRISDEMEI